MKLGFVRAQFHGLKGYPEDLLFNCSPYFETIYIGYTENKDWFNDPKYVYADISKLVPDSISGLFTRKPYSPVSLVKLQNIGHSLIVLTL